MQPLKIALTLIFTMLISSSILPQQYPIFLDLEVLNANAQVFPIGDFNFTNSIMAKNYFRVKIRNEVSTPFNLSLEMDIRYNNILIATGTSNSFDLPGNPNFPNPGPEYIFTSQELALGTAMIGGQSIELSDYDVNFDAVNKLQDQAIQTGTLPAGNYNLVLTAVVVSPNPNNIPDQVGGNNSFTISNPTYIQLLFPGNSINDNYIVEIATTFPYLQWQTDVQPSAANYDIFVYQKYPEDVTPQDVLNHPPMLQVEGYPNNFLQYPTDTQILPGGTTKILRPLEPGNTYYWIVRSNIQSATGTITLESDIHRFKISDIVGETNNAQQILIILQQILGPNYGQVLATLTEQGFDPNGEMTLNDQPVDVNTLLEIANQLSNGGLNIENVEVY